MGKSKATPYSRARLQAAIIKACEGHQNALEAAGGLINVIEHNMAIKGYFSLPELPKKHIFDQTLLALSRFDPTVALRYLNNVYHNCPPLELVKALLE